MGYPYDKTYLEQIQDSKDECEDIKRAFHVLRLKYMKEHKINDVIALGIKENFEILGEAFELASQSLDGIIDLHHFMWDVEDALLTPKEEHDK